MIYDTCEQLVDMPGMGHVREDLLPPENRFWSAGRYLIVYRWELKPLIVLDVVHGARDLDAYFARVATAEAADDDDDGA